MTPNQNQAVWELYRQGLHRIADEAEAAWQHGQPYMPEQRAPVGKQIQHLIETCNWEIEPELV